MAPGHKQQRWANQAHWANTDWEGKGWDSSDWEYSDQIKKWHPKAPQTDCQWDPNYSSGSSSGSWEDQDGYHEDPAQRGRPRGRGCGWNPARPARPFLQAPPTDTAQLATDLPGPNTLAAYREGLQLTSPPNNTEQSQVQFSNGGEEEEDNYAPSEDPNLVRCADPPPGAEEEPWDKFSNIADPGAEEEPPLAAPPPPGNWGTAMPATPTSNQCVEGFPCPPPQYKHPPPQKSMPTQARGLERTFPAWTQPQYKAPPPGAGTTIPAPPTAQPFVPEHEEIWVRCIAAGLDDNVSDEDMAALWVAGRQKMRGGLVKMRNSQAALKERRVRFAVQHGTIDEDGAAESAAPLSVAQQLGDDRNIRTARQRKAPQANGTPPVVASASLGPPQRWDAGVANMDMQFAAANAPEPGYTWVAKWKGLQPGEEVPAVDTKMAREFQTKEFGENTIDKFQKDFSQNSGNPLFLRNQLKQRWCVPYFKQDQGWPMAYCLLCGKEAWSPAHFYSLVHLKNCLSNPKSWEATWKYPQSRIPYTSVDDFEQGPHWCTEDELWDLQDCPGIMVDWASANWHLSSKPKLDSPIDSGCSRRASSAIMEEPDKQIDFFIEQMELGAEQITFQANYIELLEKKFSDYETKTAQSFRKFEEDALAMRCDFREKINVLQDALEDMKNHHADDMRQMTSISAKTSGAKTSATGCFSGLFR